ncbi:putative uncharacterized protein DDB_G0282133 [Aphidius gifuensis]|uniref:putative uncharacterized protein DDB_G0282133 n=1 Tax=Aphidius gifuensis TaxID=684658 RepID=UPI001CDCEF43|nr:putative uncharacterized protein DDB_G0282133 [Aphidius gifuensis]
MQDHIVMDDPGLSLYQGAGSIHINTNIQEQQEADNQEELKEIQQEIGVTLANNLPDWEGDEDSENSSVNSSRFHDTSRASCTNSIINLKFANDNELIQYDNYDQVHNDIDKITPVFDTDKQFHIFEQAPLTTPHNNNHNNNNNYNNNNNSNSKNNNIINNNNNNNNNNNDIIIKENNVNLTNDSDYEFPRQPRLPSQSTSFPPDITTQINDGYTILDNNYPTDYQTPSNHYQINRQNYNKNNNGYTGDIYENNNVQINNQDVNDHGFATGINGIDNTSNYEAYKAADLQSKERFEILCGIKEQQLIRLQNDIRELQAEKDTQTEKLSKKLRLAEAERNQADFSRDQTQAVLVESKAEVSKLQRYLDEYKKNIDVERKINENLNDELNVTKSTVTDLLKKIEIVEAKQSSYASDKTHEKFLKQTQDKHAAEIRSMQSQIDQLTDKLKKKDSNYISLEQQFCELQRTNEKNLLERSEAVNKLSKALQESQNKHGNLIAMNHSQENMQLQNKIKLLMDEKIEFENTIKDLQNKLEIAKADAQNYDDLLMDPQSDSIKQMKLGDYQSSSKDNEDIKNKLQCELRRCIAGQTVKRKEITKLENIISQKDLELKKSQEITSTCQQEAARYSKRVNELETKIKDMIADSIYETNAEIKRLNENLNDLQKQNETLKCEKNNLQEKLEETLAAQEESIRKIQQETIAQQEKTTSEEYNKEFLDIHDEGVKRVRQEAIIEITKLQVQLESTEKELIEIKEKYIELCVIKSDNDKLKLACDNLLKEKNDYKQKIYDLEIKLTEYKADIIELNDKLNHPNENLIISQNELENELAQYKEIVKELGDQLSNSNNSNLKKNDICQEERLKQLELKLQEKEVQLQRLHDLDKLKDERDQLVTKLKHQAKQFEQYVKSQKQVQAELNLSPRSTIDGVDFQKLREMSTKEVREEMEQKVAEELRIIDDKHREKQRIIEQKYKTALNELNEKTKNVLQAERMKLQSSFKAQEQIFTQIFEVKLDEYKRELNIRNLKIEELQTLLRRKEHEIEEEKNDMAQVMSEWILEIQTVKETGLKLQQENNKLHDDNKLLKINETKLNEAIEMLKSKITELNDAIDLIKQKYQKAKTTASNYKIYAANKEKFLSGECKRIEEGYKKALNQVEQKLNEMIDTQEKEVNEKLTKMQNNYEEQIQKLRQKQKYKEKN